MKIDPVTYEVDMSAGTHPLYVWEAPVRVWHWAMMVCMFVMIPHWGAFGFQSRRYMVDL